MPFNVAITTPDWSEGSTNELWCSPSIVRIDKVCSGMIALKSITFAQMLIDTHTHIYADAFDDDRDEAINVEAIGVSQ